MAAVWLLLGLLFAAPVAAHPEGPTPAGAGGLRSKRRLFSWSQRLQHIWGRCDRWDRDMTGCSLKEGTSCASYLSPGPEDADVEVQLAGLPASTAQEEVHLQWWAARRSPSKYDVLATPKGASVYWCFNKAYATFNHKEFNGGNVRVDPSGKATIRIRAPATYTIWRYLAIPHIHLRVCRGASFVENATDTVYFGKGEQWVRSASCKSKIKIVSAKKYMPKPGAQWVKTTEPAPAFITRIKMAGGSASTTLPMSRVTTTTTVKTLPASMTEDEKNLTLDAAKDALDLDALEFSPVYQCLLAGKFFDQLSFACRDWCPAGTVVVHAQCVKRATETEDQAFNKWWTMSVVCEGSACWHSKMKNVLHNLRLNVAGVLDIPFQEVVEVGAKFSRKATTSRRLGVTREMLAWVKVSTKRVKKQDGVASLDGFMTEEAFAENLLGLKVAKISKSGGGVYKDSDYTGKIVVDKDSDPYSPAYTELESKKSTTSSGSGLLGFLPLPALIGISAVVVVALSLFVGLLWCRKRRMARRQREEAANSKAKAEKLQKEGKEVAMGGDEEDAVKPKNLDYNDEAPAVQDFVDVAPAADAPRGVAPAADAFPSDEEPEAAVQAEAVQEEAAEEEALETAEIDYLSDEPVEEPGEGPIKSAL